MCTSQSVCSQRSVASCSRCRTKVSRSITVFIPTWISATSIRRATIQWRIGIGSLCTCVCISSNCTSTTVLVAYLSCITSRWWSRIVYIALSQSITTNWWCVRVCASRACRIVIVAGARWTTGMANEVAANLCGDNWSVIITRLPQTAKAWRSITGGRMTTVYTGSGDCTVVSLIGVSTSCWLI